MKCQKLFSGKNKKKMTLNFLLLNLPREWQRFKGIISRVNNYKDQAISLLVYCKNSLNMPLITGLFIYVICSYCV